MVVVVVVVVQVRWRLCVSVSRERVQEKLATEMTSIEERIRLDESQRA